MPEQFSTMFINLENIGKEKYHKFLEDQLNGEKSIWDTITKEKLPTFITSNKQVTVKINKQLVNVKEERKLMSRFVIASRSRSDIDLPNYFATSEFSVIPRSLLTMDGILHQINDKATIAREIQEVYHDLEDMIGDDRRQRKVMIIDGMAVVNRINIKKSKIKNCQEFAEPFINIVLHEATGCDEIRVVFDRYIEDSLKAQTRSKQTGNLPVHYRVLEETQIGHLDTKQFLSSIKKRMN